MRQLNSKVFILLFLGCFTSVPAFVNAQTGDLTAKGQYIFALAGGCACHTVPKGTPHIGGRAFPIPFGTVMPYEKYSGMAQEDLKALIAYLRTLKPVKKAPPELKTWVPLVRSVGTPIFLKIFGRFNSAPAQAPKSGVERGRYLVEHVSLCGDCHTPRNFIGVPKQSLYLAGAGKKIGPLGEAVPNITPDKETGIGEWKREDIAELLIAGTKPDLDNVQGLMYEVIQGTPHGFKDMKKEDALAVADYLKSIPAIKNKVDK